MALPVQLKDFDEVLNVGSAATISAGFTVAIPAPTRCEIVGVYMIPIDGTTAITAGPATLTFTVGGTAGATVSMLAAAAGVASGTTAALGSTLSARQFANEGDTIKMVLGAGLTCAVNAVISLVIRERTI